MADLDLYQGEGKTLTLTYTNPITKAAIVLTGATLSFKLAATIGGTALISKADTDFNKVQIASGIVTFTVSTTETNLPAGIYFGQAKAAFSTTNTDISQIYMIRILPTVV